MKKKLIPISCSHFGNPKLYLSHYQFGAGVQDLGLRVLKILYYAFYAGFVVGTSFMKILLVYPYYVTSQSLHSMLCLYLLDILEIISHIDIYN